MSQSKLRFFRAASLPAEAQIGDIYFIYDGTRAIYIYTGGEDPWEAYTGNLDLLSIELDSLQTEDKTIIGAINELNSAVKRYPIVFTDSNSIYIRPGQYYIWTSGSVPNTIDFANISGTHANEYIIRFSVTGTSTPAISFEYNIAWANNDVPTWTSGWEYEVCIVIANGIGLASYNKFPIV